MPSEAVTFSSWCSIWYGAESDFSTFSATCAAPSALALGRTDELVAAKTGDRILLAQYMTQTSGDLDQ